jgi:hypothetical protein
LFLDFLGGTSFFYCFIFREAPRFRLPHCDVARFMFGTVGRRTLALVIAFFLMRCEMRCGTEKRVGCSFCFIRYLVLFFSFAGAMMRLVWICAAAGYTPPLLLSTCMYLCCARNHTRCVFVVIFFGFTNWLLCTIVSSLHFLFLHNVYYYYRTCNNHTTSHHIHRL